MKEFGYDYDGNGKPNLITAILFCVLTIIGFIFVSWPLGLTCLLLAILNFIVYHFIKKGKL